jgi:hydrogenase nickel incorporation protein HypA/HybF
MHELSVASAVLNTALKHSDDRPVSVVSLRVGRMRQVVVDSLSFYFEIVAHDGLCEGARLELEAVPLRLRCRDCDAEWEPEYPEFRCPDCDGASVEIMTGEELEVDYIEVEEEAACIARR